MIIMIVVLFVSLSILFCDLNDLYRRVQRVSGRDETRHLSQNIGIMKKSP